MADSHPIELVEVRASPPAPRGPVNLETGEQPRWITLALTVRNTSTTRYFAIGSVRRLRYDPGSATLSLELEEREPANGDTGFAWQLTPPQVVELPPDSPTVIVVSVPEVVNWITVPAPTESGVAVETVDISGVQQVQCSVAYADYPFEADPDASPEAMARSLASWGRTIEATVPVVPDKPWKGQSR